MKLQSSSCTMKAIQRTGGFLCIKTMQRKEYKNECVAMQSGFFMYKHKAKEVGK